jgi:hypothetical protein
MVRLMYQHQCVEIKGDYIEKIARLFYFCHLKKLVRAETFGPTFFQVHFFLEIWRSNWP